MLELYLDYAITHKQPVDDGYQNTENIPAVIDVQPAATKILHNGEILIRRGDKIYTLTGKQVNSCSL